MARPAASAIQDRPILGIGLMLVAYLVFSFIDTGAKWLGLLGLPAMQLAFMRYIGHFAVSTALIGAGGLSWDRFGTDRWFMVVVRATMLMAATISNFIAIQFIPLTLTSTILFSSPIISCLLSLPLRGERVGLWRWGAIMLGFVGILIAIRPFDEDFHWAVILSLIGATCFALYSILTRHLSGVVATDTLQFYTGLIGSACLLPLALWQWQNPDGLFAWAVMISLGLFGFIGHELLTRAHGMAEASVLNPFGYSFILYLTAWSYLVFAHIPDQWTIAGALIIVVAGMIIWVRERQTARLRAL